MAGCYVDDTTPEQQLDALYPYVLPYVLGVPEPVMAGEIRLALVEFCRRSGILHDENWIDLQKNVQEYFLETHCEYDIVRIFRVDMLNRWSFSPTIQRPIGNQGGPFNSIGYWGTGWWCGPWGFYVVAPNVIRITPATQQDFKKGLRVEFIIQPKQDSCGLNSYLYQQWAEGIAAGAIARLKRMKGQDIQWYDPQGAAEFEAKFQKELGRARSTSDMNNTSGPVMMTAQRFI